MAAQRYNSFIYLYFHFHHYCIIFVNYWETNVTAHLLYEIWTNKKIYYIFLFVHIPTKMQFLCFHFEKHLKKVTFLLNVQTLVMSDDYVFTLPVCSPNCISLQEEKGIGASEYVLFHELVMD